MPGPSHRFYPNVLVAIKHGLGFPRSIMVSAVFGPFRHMSLAADGALASAPRGFFGFLVIPTLVFDDDGSFLYNDGLGASCVHCIREHPSL